MVLACHTPRESRQGYSERLRLDWLIRMVNIMDNPPAEVSAYYRGPIHPHFVARV